MNIYTIWKQYPQSYPGELMPNIADAIDEFANDDNPDYFEKAELWAKKEVADGTIDAYPSAAPAMVPSNSQRLGIGHILWLALR